MRNCYLLLCFLFPILLHGQNKYASTEMLVLKETLPQFLNNSPYSIASYLKGGGTYEFLVKSMHFASIMDSTNDEKLLKKDLDQLSDSISEVLQSHKILVQLSDTLYAYQYVPSFTEYKDGSVDTTDLRDKETWQYTKNDLVEVFQTDYQFRGMKQQVDLDFIDLIYKQINLSAPTQTINLGELDYSFYIYRAEQFIPTGSIAKETIHLLQLYKPVFNKRMKKACYLISAATDKGPYREFIFVEKKKKHWIFVESYGAHNFE